MPTVGKLSAALLFAAVAATLFPKALATNFNASEDVARLNRDIARRLDDSGFSILRRSEIVRSGTFYARRGDCRIVVRHAIDPHAYSGRYRQVTQPTGPLRYRIGKQVFAEPPLFGLWVRDKLHLARVRLGIASPRAAMLAIAMSPECSPDALRTHDLLVYPAGSHLRT